MAEHGTRRRYQLGCHCPECRAANAAAMRRLRKDGPRNLRHTTRRDGEGRLLCEGYGGPLRAHRVTDPPCGG